MTPAGCDELQNDLHSMYKWSGDWQMIFNIGKYKYLHFGHGNNQSSYRLEGTDVPTVVQENDIGAIVTEES